MPIKELQRGASCPSTTRQPIETDEDIELSNFQNFISVTGSGVEVTLPPSPQAAQTHRVIAPEGFTVTVNGNGHPITGAGASYEIRAGFAQEFTFSATDEWATCEVGSSSSGGLPDGWFDPRDYGAALDGINDDLPAMQATLDAMPEEGGVLYMGEGVAWLSDTFNISKPIHVLGCGGRARDFSGFIVAPGKTCLSLNFYTIESTPTSASGFRVEQVWLRSQILVHETANGSAGGFGVGNQFAANATVRKGDCYIRASNASPEVYFRATSFTDPDATVGQFGAVIPAWSDTPASTVLDNGILWTTEVFPTVRQNSHAYVVGDQVYADKDNRYVFLCVVAGTSDSSPPAEMAGGNDAAAVGIYVEFTDGTVTWQCTLATSLYINSSNGVVDFVQIEGFTGYAIQLQAGTGQDARGMTIADGNRIYDPFAQYCGGGVATAGDDANGWEIDGAFFISNGVLQPTPAIALASGYTDLGAHGLHDHSLGGGTLSNFYIQLSTGRPVLKNGLGRVTCVTCNQEVPMASRVTIAGVLDLGGDLFWDTASDGLVTRITQGGGEGFQTDGVVGGGTLVHLTLTEENTSGVGGFYQFRISHPGDVNFWAFKYGYATPTGWVGFQHGVQSIQNAYLLSTTQVGLDIGAGWLGFQYGFMTGDPDTGTPLYDGHLDSITFTRLRSTLREAGDRFRSDVTEAYILEEGYRAPAWVAGQPAGVEYAPWAIPAFFVMPTSPDPSNTAGGCQVWKCTTAGTTGLVEPTWPASPTPGVTTQVDNDVVWTFAGYSPAYDVAQRATAKAQQVTRTGEEQTTTATASQVILDGGIVDGIDYTLPDNAITVVSDVVTLHKPGTASGGRITVESTWVRNGGAPVQIGSTVVDYNLSGSTLDGTTVAHVANGSRIELQGSPESAETLNWRVYRTQRVGRD